jgi:L-malate glycosyltransferase
MRIFAMINTLDVGGSESQFAAVATRLVSRGHSVTVGCLKKQGIHVQSLQSAGIPVVEFSPEGSLLGWQGIAALLKLSRYLRCNQFDVVHTHDLYSNLLGLPAAWLARVPRIISSRRDLGNWWWYTRRNRRILRFIQKLSDVVVANSMGVRQWLIEQDGFQPSHIRVLYNGLDIERFANLHVRREDLLPDCIGKRLVVVCANMHTHTKGHEDIITAAQNVCSDFPDCVFVLIGDGELRPALEERVRCLGVSEHFRFLGARRDVPAILACCDIGLLASRAEGLPNSVLEYMAAGLPVVATAVGGIPELFKDGEAGLLVNPSKPAALASAISRLLTDVPTAQAMGRLGRRRVQEEFTFDALLNRLEQLYRDAKPFSDSSALNKLIESTAPAGSSSFAEPASSSRQRGEAAGAGLGQDR